MQIDVTPARHRAVADGREQFLAALAALFLSDFLLPVNFSVTV
jgi:hypothetical protein